MPTLASELVGEVCKEFAEDGETSRVLSQVSSIFSAFSRPNVFSKLVFKDQADVFRFIELASAPASTIPRPLKCKHLNLEDATDIFNAYPAAAAFFHSIAVQGSLAIMLVNGTIPAPILHAPAKWKASIVKVAITGGMHTPSTLFAFLASFPKIQSLQLQDVQLVLPTNASDQYRLPPGVTTLALLQCATFWTFIKRHVIPSGGTAGVRWLYVQERFLRIPEVLDMFDCFKAREFEGVKDITLKAVYDEEDPHMDIDMANLLVPKPFMKMRGLQRLRVNLTAVPSTVAMNFLGWCGFCRYRHTVEVIDVYMPPSATHWPDERPGEELGRFLREMKAFDPKEPAAVVSKAKLVVRGFPGQLPESLEFRGGSAVCGWLPFSLAFEACDWKEAVEDRMEGL